MTAACLTVRQCCSFTALAAYHAFLDMHTGLAGIVGRINPVMWQALQAAMVATATSDFDMLARALATVGATSTDVDIQVCCNPSSRITSLFFSSVMVSCTVLRCTHVMSLSTYLCTSRVHWWGLLGVQSRV